jgi:hypothetical protein
MQSVPITTNIVSPNPAHVEFVSDLRVSGGGGGGPVASTNKTGPPWYNWNIVESGFIHHNLNLIII